MNVMILRQRVKESARKMRNYVEKNIKDIKQKNIGRDEQVQQLRNVLTNIPGHFFGDHSQYTENPFNDCQKIKENIIASLETVGIY